MNELASTRFHELVDKEFLRTLNSDETKELEILTWLQNKEKSRFYQEIRDKCLIPLDKKCLELELFREKYLNSALKKTKRKRKIEN